MSKKRKQIVLHPEELKKGLILEKEMNSDSFSAMVGELITQKEANFKTMIALEEAKEQIEHLDWFIKEKGFNFASTTNKDVLNLIESVLKNK